MCLGHYGKVMAVWSVLYSKKECVRRLQGGLVIQKKKPFPDVGREKAEA
ncbi:hypothetical protein [Peribacillus sp. NPDC058076]